VLVVRRLDGVDVAIGELNVERGDGFGEVVGLVAPTMGAETTGLRSTQARATWAIVTSPASASFCTASTTGWSRGESKACTT
jgi:hypothetical protein